MSNFLSLQPLRYEMSTAVWSARAPISEAGPSSIWRWVRQIDALRGAHFASLVHGPAPSTGISSSARSAILPASWIPRLFGTFVLRKLFGAFTSRTTAPAPEHATANSFKIRVLSVAVRVFTSKYSRSAPARTNSSIPLQTIEHLERGLRGLQGNWSPIRRGRLAPGGWVEWRRVWRVHVGAGRVPSSSPGRSALVSASMPSSRCTLWWWRSRGRVRPAAPRPTDRSLQSRMIINRSWLVKWKK